MSSAARWQRTLTLPLADKADDAAPYFSLVLVPGWERAAVTGRLAVIGLGPGRADQLTAEAAAAIDAGERPFRLRPLSRRG